MSDWQSIETAPKDGSDVLLSNGYWVFEATSLPDGRFIRTKDGQQTAPCNCRFWMPLPRPPEDAPLLTPIEFLTRDDLAGLFPTPPKE